MEGDLEIKLEFDKEIKRSMEEALENGPWVVMGFCLSLKKWSSTDQVLKDIEFRKVPIWIQIHNLPLEMLTKHNAEKMRRVIGVLTEVVPPS
ncbi:hypothetical protein DITRI_Ditri06bG0102500 [Diplodiscus trichospermus]